MVVLSRFATNRLISWIDSMESMTPEPEPTFAQEIEALVEVHSHECPLCGGTGRVPNDDDEAAAPDPLEEPD
jgi:phage/plasmid primase-like uncharacterized protein